jgi:hypothetical protein
MAQTTDAFSTANGSFEYATDGGTTWNDACGETVSITVGGGTRQTSGTSTLCGDTQILTAAKRELIELTITVLGIGSDSGLQADAITAYEAASNLMVRWSPQGGATGDFRKTSAAKTLVTTPPYLGADSTSSDAAQVELTLMTESVTRAVIS